MAHHGPNEAPPMVAWPTRLDVVRGMGWFCHSSCLMIGVRSFRSFYLWRWELKRLARAPLWASHLLPSSNIPCGCPKRLIYSASVGPLAFYESVRDKRPITASIRPSCTFFHTSSIATCLLFSMIKIMTVLCSLCLNHNCISLMSQTSC
jgi:hypothetical protein